MKFKIFLSTLPVILSLSLVSCLRDDDTSSSNVIDNSDAQIYSFSLSTDSIPELKDITFSIDQLNELIYNRDSLSYGTNLSKALCSLTTSATVIMIPEASNDTIHWKASDSIDFSKPVKIITYALDGIQFKTYTAKLNVHQQEGDKIAWTQLTDKAIKDSILFQKTIALNGSYYTYAHLKNGNYYMYFSSSGSTWTQQSLSGFPSEPNLESLISFSNKLYIADTAGKVYESTNAGSWTPFSTDVSVKTFIGIVPKTELSPALLCAITNKDGSAYFGAAFDMITWKIGTEPVPDNFPISGFCAASDSNPDAGYAGLIAAGGKNRQNELLNTVWRTSDGIHWIQLIDEKANYFSPREGMSLVYYINKYYLLGGKDVDENCTNDMYISVTNGVTWAKADDHNSITDLYSPRAYASVCVTENRLMLFGGTNGGAYWLDDVWSGFLNKLGFIVK